MSHTVTRTQTVQEPQRFQVIHLVAQPVLPSGSADPILDCLQDMMEEGFVAQGNLAVMIENYKGLAAEDGFGKAILVCQVISKIVQAQMEMEKNEKILSLLCDCETRLMEMLQNLLVKDINAEDFLALYHVRCMQMEDEQARQKKIAVCSRLAIQQMNASAEEVKQHIDASNAELSGRISRLAEYKEQMTLEQRHKVADLAKRVEKAHQNTMKCDEEIQRLAIALEQDQFACNQLTQWFRPLMEKIQRQ